MFASKSFKGDKQICITVLKNVNNQIDFITIDGNDEFVHCIVTSQVFIQFLYPTKLLIIVILLE